MAPLRTHPGQAKNKLWQSCGRAAWLPSWFKSWDTGATVITKVLLIDDDAALTRVLGAALLDEGFVVSVASNGREGLERIAADTPDLVVLDILMPEIDGLEVCRRVRKTSRMPIILLSSRAEEVDRINGLETGADDYLTKPFSTRELVARIRAISRRLEPEAPREPPSLLGAERLQAGALSLDASRFSVTFKDAPVNLTRTEFQILAALVRSRGVVLGRERLLDLARGDEANVTDRTVDTFIKRIRKKIRDVDAGFDDIETVFGIGYRYRS